MKFNRFVMSALLGSLMASASFDVLAATSASEMAVVTAPLPSSGFYAGFGFGYAPVSGSSLITSSNGWSVDGRAGYAFNRNWSAEVAFDGITSVKSGTVDVGISIFSASLVGYYPVKENIDLYGKVGYANANVGFISLGSSVDQTKTGLTYGFGVELGHGNKNSLRLGMDHYDLSAWPTLPISANNFTLSIDFRF
ncbi:MAG: porin family protein [Nitrosomonadales bacterium]|nr:porin family protein [Nitrosomonadales bacterium]